MICSRDNHTLRDRNDDYRRRFRRQAVGRTLRFALLTVLMFLLVWICDVTKNSAYATGMENHVFNRPRGQDQPDNELISQARKYLDVGCDGDLRLNIPLLSVPGKLGFPLNLYYQSGIKMDQSASWVGLGWTFGGWSVKKLTVHGDDNHTYFIGDGRQTRYHINDEYVVTLPDRSITFINIGTVFAPNFVPQMYTRDSLEVRIDSVYTDMGWHTDWGIPGANFRCSDEKHWEYRKYLSFVLTDENGTKYVFGKAVRTPTVADARHDLAIFTSYEDANEVDGGVDIRLSHSENSEWLLTAILSHDYIDGGGNLLDPMDVARPIRDNRGEWIVFKYGDGVTEDVKLRHLSLGVGCSCATNTIADTVQAVILSRIVTPRTVVKFNTTYLANYRTPGFWKSGNTSSDCISGPTDRVKDRQLGQMLVFENRDEIGTPDGDTLFCVQFNYEDNESQSALKTNYYRWQWRQDCSGSTIDGEATLRSVEIGTGLRYSGGMHNEYGHLVAADPDSSGIKRVFRFTYHDTLDNTASPTGYSDWFNPYQTQFARYIDWLYGRQRAESNNQCPKSELLDWQSCVEQSYLESDTIDLFSCAWGDRDFFGFHHEMPWAWSVKKMFTPDGLAIGVEYESDKVMLDYTAPTGGADSSLWVTGGCRVSQIILNKIDRWWPNPELYEHLNRYDRIFSDTIDFTYGNDSREVGYATSWPGNYYSFQRRTQFAHLNFDGSIRASEFINFLPDFAPHIVQYPHVVWTFSGGRGRTERFYTTSRATADHPTAPHKLYYIASDTLRTCGDPQFSIWWILRHGVWLDRSPLHGVHYKEASFDAAGNEVAYWQRYITWDVKNAILFRDDHAEFPATTLCDCMDQDYVHDYIYRNRDDISFPAGDTLAICYFLRTDSVLSRQDGVSRKTAYIYEDGPWRRLRAQTVYGNGSTRTDEFKYLKDPTTTGPLRRYRVLKKACSTFVDNTLESYSGMQYHREVVATWDVLTLVRDSAWWDQNDDRWIDGTDLFQICSDSIDEWGDTVRTTQPDNSTVHRIHDHKGVIAEVGNASDRSYAYYSAESLTGRQPGQWTITGTRSDKQAFTGKYSVELAAGQSIEISLPVQPAGWMHADCWAMGSPGSDIQLILQARSGTTVVGQCAAILTGAANWQILQCSVLVVPGQNVRGYVTGVGQATYIDDFRVFPLAALMTTTTYDGLGRVTSQSDANNIPTRFYYNAFNEKVLEADWQGSPLRGTETYYKSADISSWTPDGFDESYLTYKPNARYTFTCRGTGVVDDFSLRSLSRYQETGTGSDSVEYMNGHLYFRSTADTSRRVDLKLPVVLFSDGFLAFDYYDSSCTVPPGSQPTDTAFGQTCSLWFGFEDANGRGYAFAISQLHQFYAWKFSDSAQYNRPGLQQRVAYFQNPPIMRWSGGKAPQSRQRIMIGKIGSNYYLFQNGDCLYGWSDPSYDAFSTIHFRFKKPRMGFVSCDRIRIDNLVFYNDPVITTEFINAYGLPKQIQTFDGQRVEISGKTYTEDGLVEAELLPIFVTPSASYGNFAEVNLDRINPFDYIDGYFPYESAHTWRPGDPLTDSSLLLKFYRDSADAPNCQDTSGIIRPYTVHYYEGSPLRREIRTEFPGPFAPHPIQIDFGRGDIPLPGRSSLTFAPDSVMRSTVTDENGNKRADYFDKSGRKILERTNFRNVADTGSSFTQFYPDLNGNDTLIIQPEGQTIWRKYNTLGWMVEENHPDRGRSRLLFDLSGRVRFVQTAADLAAARFVYTKYDRHGRPLEVGTVADTTLMTMTRARQRDFPSGEQYPRLVAQDNVWDVGQWGRGRLQLTRSYAAFDVLHISYEAYAYDHRGRVVTKRSSVYPLDRTIQQRPFHFAYNNVGQIDSITYPNEAVITYLYDGAGRVTDVRDGEDGLNVRASFSYWPGGLTRQTRLGALLQPAQLVDYCYNARGWLVSMNDPEAVSSTDTTTADHVGLNLTYETGALGSPGGYYNGDVASYKAKISPGSSAYTTHQKFAYDGADRIKQEQFVAGVPQPPELTYSYDKNGNITKLQPEAGSALIYRCLPGTNRVTDVTNLYPDSNNLQYTPSGALESIACYGMRMSYDALERMYQRSRGRLGLTRDTVTYWYTSDGWRSAKLHKYWEEYACSDSLPPVEGFMDSETIWPRPLRGIGFLLAMTGPPVQTCYRQKSHVTGYYYDLDNNVLAEYGGDPIGMPGSGGLVGNYVYVNGKRIARFGGTADVGYYLTDHLGSVLAMVDNAGRVTNKDLYRSFGQSLVEQVSTPDAFHYTGKERDEELTSEWDYFGARWYVPELRQFVQVDPAWEKYPGLGPYQYTANNPVKYIDKNGKWLETGWDIFNLALDVNNIVSDVRGHRWLDAGIDAGGFILDLGLTLVPIAPAFVGSVRQGSKVLDAAVDLGKLSKQTAGAAKSHNAARLFDSFEAFKRTMGPAGEGMHWHHIVEQTGNNLSRFGARAIHNTENVVAVPAEVNHLINGYYSGTRPFTGGKTVREWLSSKSYEEAKEFGKKVLDQAMKGGLLP